MQLLIRASVEYESKGGMVGLEIASVEHSLYQEDAAPRFAFLIMHTFTYLSNKINIQHKIQSLLHK